MTTAEAIKAVKEVTGMSLPWDDRHYEALQMAIKAMEQPESKWIPVGEGLPKKKGYYFVTRKNPKGYVKKASFDPSRVERGVYNSPWGNGDSDVLAWMELPKPFEVKEE